jgi:hypothetical protein
MLSMVALISVQGMRQMKVDQGQKNGECEGKKEK